MRCALVQARMTSKRLPGKVLMKANEKTLLEILISRLSLAKQLDEIVVITSKHSSDNPIVEVCERVGCQVYRGSLRDVLDRAYNASKSYGASIIARITADCVLMDPRVVDMVVNNHNDDYSLTRNIIDKEGGYPRGLDVEVMTSETLEEINRRAEDRYNREHFTHYIYEHPELYNIRWIEAPEGLRCDPHWRLCVDEWEDFLLIRSIVEAFGRRIIEAGIEEICEFLWENPKLAVINRHVRQRT